MPDREEVRDITLDEIIQDRGMEIRLAYYISRVKGDKDLALRTRDKQLTDEDREALNANLREFQIFLKEASEIKQFLSNQYLDVSSQYTKEKAKKPKKTGWEKTGGAIKNFWRQATSFSAEEPSAENEEAEEADTKYESVLEKTEGVREYSSSIIGDVIGNSSGLETISNLGVNVEGEIMEDMDYLLMDDLNLFESIKKSMRKMKEYKRKFERIDREISRLCKEHGGIEADVLAKVLDITDNDERAEALRDALGPAKEYYVEGGKAEEELNRKGDLRELLDEAREIRSNLLRVFENIEDNKTVKRIARIAEGKVKEMQEKGAKENKIKKLPNLLKNAGFDEKKIPGIVERFNEGRLSVVELKKMVKKATEDDPNIQKEIFEFLDSLNADTTTEADDTEPTEGEGEAETEPTAEPEPTEVLNESESERERRLFKEAKEKIDNGTWFKSKETDIEGDVWFVILEDEKRNIDKGSIEAMNEAGYEMKKGVMYFFTKPNDKGIVEVKPPYYPHAKMEKKEEETVDFKFSKDKAKELKETFRNKDRAINELIEALEKAINSGWINEERANNILSLVKDRRGEVIEKIDDEIDYNNDSEDEIELLNRIQDKIEIIFKGEELEIDFDSMSLDELREFIADNDHMGFGPIKQKDLRDKSALLVIVKKAVKKYREDKENKEIDRFDILTRNRLLEHAEEFKFNVNDDTPTSEIREMCRERQELIDKINNDPEFAKKFLYDFIEDKFRGDQDSIDDFKAQIDGLTDEERKAYALSILKK